MTVRKQLPAPGLPPPGSRPPDFTTWATYIPTRTTGPHFKRHSNRGHALNALKNADSGVLYEWGLGLTGSFGWSEVYRIENYTKQHIDCKECEKCGKDISDRISYIALGKPHNYNDVVWVDKPTIHLEMVCRGCAHYYRKILGRVPRHSS